MILCVLHAVRKSRLGGATAQGNILSQAQHNIPERGLLFNFLQGARRRVLRLDVA